MAKQTVNIGASVNDGSGDPARTAFNKLNQNNTELYDFVGGAADTTTLPVALPLTKGGTGATTAAAARTNLGLGAVATEDSVPITKGGTGATTSADARTNLGLGTAATYNVDSFVRTSNVVNNDASQASGMYIYAPSSKPSGLTLGHDYGVVIKASHEFAGTRAEICIPHNTGTTGSLVYRSATTMPWKRVRDSVNTTIDGNGFIKNASPIVQLFADKIELNDEAQQQNIVFEKLGAGDYLIKGSTGLAQEGWYIEQPKDSNGNIYHAVEYGTHATGDLWVKTYEQMMDGTRIVADHTKPVDIKENRFISIRLNELPEDTSAPTNPTIKDSEGNAAPSRLHELVGGVWVISDENAAILEQERLAAMEPLTRRQFRLALALNGYDLAEIEGLINQIDDQMQRQIALIEWQDATTFERNNPTLIEMAGLLELSSSQVDELWKQAITL